MTSPFLNRTYLCKVEIDYSYLQSRGSHYHHGIAARILSISILYP